MSELKAFNMPRYAGVFTTHEVYLKSEADKVIDDLEESHKMEVEQLLIEIAELKDIDSKNRSAYYKDLAMMAKDVERHKHKRCLAMADKCVDLCHKAKDLYRWAEDENLEHYYNHKIEFFARWHKRWLTMADKYKEGNV